jgi:hypothetical protein
VPEGDADDATRDPAEFDAIARFLLECGAVPLDDMIVPVAEAAVTGALL